MSDCFCFAPPSFAVSNGCNEWLPDRELGSAELEFFRHRIHLEQDLVRQARNLLRAQHNVYLTRLHNLKQKRTVSQKADPSVSTNALNQMAQEERELAQMEAGLQRTRSLLCEKIIRLRRLENSLRHVSDTAETKNPRKKGEGDRKYAWEGDNVNQDTSSDSGESSMPNIPFSKLYFNLLYVNAFKCGYSSIGRISKRLVREPISI